MLLSGQIKIKNWTIFETYLIASINRAAWSILLI